MGRKRPPGAKRKGPSVNVTVSPFEGELPDVWRRAAEAQVVFLVGAAHDFAAAQFCHDFMESTEFDPVPRPDNYSFMSTADAEMDDLGVVAILAHGLHPNHVEALRDEVARSPHYSEWEVYIPDDIDSLDA